MRTLVNKKQLESPKNICIDAREFIENRKTGIARYLENMLLSFKNESKFDFTLLLKNSSALPKSLKNSKFKCINIPQAPTLITDQYLLPKLAETNNADIFFSPYYKVPLCGNFKRIITVHDIMFLKLKSFSFKRFLAEIQLKLTTGKADIILTDSEFSKNDLAERLPAISNKIKVVYPTINPEWSKPFDETQTHEIRNKYSAGLPFLLYVGNFKPHKNIELLIKSFIKAKETGSINNKHLLLAGGDPMNMTRIKTLIHSTGMEKLIQIHPYIPDTELKTLYAAAEWFISTSKYEGFGYPILEAMTCGCPVIYYPCTSIPEITGNMPVLIDQLTINDIANSISKAFTISTDERYHFIKQGRQKAKRFLRNGSARIFRTIIESMT